MGVERVRCAGGVLVLGVTALAMSGCAAAGVAGDVASSTIDATQQLFKAGKADSFDKVSLGDAIAAVRKVAGELGLTEVRSSPHPDQLKLVYRDDRKQDVTITVIRRTNSVVEIHVDVGLLGPEGLGRLVLREILAQLPGRTGENHRGVESLGH